MDKNRHIYLFFFYIIVTEDKKRKNPKQKKITCLDVNSLNHKPINCPVFKKIIISCIFYMVIVHNQFMNNNSRVFPFWFQCHLSYADFKKLMNIQINRIVLNICKQNMKRCSYWMNILGCLMLAKNGVFMY